MARKSKAVDPFAVVRKAATLTDSVIVGVSGGKDSLCALDLAYKHFKNIWGYHLYSVPDLPSWERYKPYLAERYPRMVLTDFPHWTMSTNLKFGIFRNTRHQNVPLLKANDMDLYLRAKSGFRWIVGGERIADSLMRRGMISKHGKVDLIRGRFYLVADWTKAHVINYLRRESIRLSDENYYLGHSWANVEPRDLVKVAEHDPEDFEHICRHYPHARAAIAKAEMATQYRKDSQATFATGAKS